MNINYGFGLFLHLDFKVERELVCIRSRHSIGAELGVRRQVWTSQVDLGQVNPFLWATLFSITKGRKKKKKRKALYES